MHGLLQSMDEGLTIFLEAATRPTEALAVVAPEDGESEERPQEPWETQAQRYAVLGDKLACSGQASIGARRANMDGYTWDLLPGEAPIFEGATFLPWRPAPPPRPRSRLDRTHLFHESISSDTSSDAVAVAFLCLWLPLLCPL